MIERSRVLIAVFCACIILVGVHGQGSSEDEQQQQIGQKYGASGKAKTIRDALPRVYGPKLDVANPKKTFEGDAAGYAIQIGAFAAPGVFFLLFAILGFPLFCCFRYCCNCCCGCRDQKKGGYLPKEKWHPYIGLAVLAAGLVAFGITGYVSSEGLHTALFGEGDASTKPGLSKSVDQLFADSLSTIGYLNSSLKILYESTGPVVDEVNRKLDSTTDSVLRLGSQGVVDRLNTFSDNLSNLTITVRTDGRALGLVPNITYICDYCRTAGDALTATAQNVKETADSTFSSLNDTNQNVKRLLVDGRAQLEEYTGDAYDQVSSARGHVDDARDQFNDFVDVGRPFEEQRRQAVLGLFCLPLITSIFIVLGGVCKSSGHPFTVSCSTTWITFLLLSILLMIHFPISILFADLCAVIDYADQHIEEVSGSKDIATFVNTCLTNESLTDAYNLTDKLSLSGLTFPQVPNITDVFGNFTLLDERNREIQALNFSTFGYDPAQIGRNMLQINNLTALYESPHYDYTRFNLSDLDETQATPQPIRLEVTIYKYQTLELIDAEFQLNASLVAAKRNMSEIIEYVNELKANMSKVQDGLKGIERLADPLIATAKDLARGVTCGFVGDAYLNVKNAFCDSIVTSMSIMSFMSFLILVFSIPVLVISTILSTRFAGKMVKFGPDGKPIPTNDKGEEIDGALGQNGALDTSGGGAMGGQSTGAGVMIGQSPAGPAQSSVQLTKFAADGSIIVDNPSQHASVNSVQLDMAAQKQAAATPAYVPPGGAGGAGGAGYYGQPTEPQQQPQYASQQQQPAPTTYGGAGDTNAPAYIPSGTTPQVAPVPIYAGTGSGSNFDQPHANPPPPAPDNFGAPAYVPTARASEAPAPLGSVYGAPQSITGGVGDNPALIPGTMPPASGFAPQ